MSEITTNLDKITGVKNLGNFAFNLKGVENYHSDSFNITEMNISAMQKRDPATAEGFPISVSIISKDRTKEITPFPRDIVCQLISPVRNGFLNYPNAFF